MKNLNYLLLVNKLATFKLLFQNKTRFSLVVQFQE